MTTTALKQNAAEKEGETRTRDRAVGESARWSIADIIVPEGMIPRQERVLELAASIEVLGVLLEPVLITPEGGLVAGLHRLKACEHLGHETIEVRVLDLDDLRLRLATIDENLIRKNLDALERAELLHERKTIYEALSPDAARPNGGRPPNNGESASPFSKVTAGLTGCHPRTVQTDIQIVADIPKDVRDRIRHTALGDNKQELLKLARHDELTQRKLATKLAGGARHLYEAEREVRMDEAQERARSLPVSIPNCQVFHCSCEDLIGKIEAGSVDLILADPPYGAEELIPCCEELGRLAAHALTPNGSLLVMVGQMHADAAKAVLARYLFDRWSLVYLMRHGGSPVVPTVQRRVNSWYKPVLWLTRPEYDGPVHGDVIEGGPKAKFDHDWEQDVEGAARMVELFSDPRGLVVDPFVCTGTTGVAALRLGRRFVGCDTDDKVLVGARVRLHEASSQRAV